MDGGFYLNTRRLCVLQLVPDMKVRATQGSVTTVVKSRPDNQPVTPRLLVIHTQLSQLGTLGDFITSSMYVCVCSEHNVQVELTQVPLIN